MNATGTITVTAFTCATNTVSDIDGNTYNTLLLGTQCWTKENLRVRRYNDGTWIRFDNSGGTAGNGSDQTWSSTYGAHTIYAHDSTATTGNLATYGYLYNWYAVKGITTSGSTTYINICPSGWHVPTSSEWNILINTTLGTNAGGKMKSTSSLWSSQSSAANDSSGFSALPGGFRHSNSNFQLKGSHAFFWCTSDNNANTLGETRYIQSSSNGVNVHPDYKIAGMSIRCLKDY